MRRLHHSQFNLVDSFCMGIVAAVPAVATNAKYPYSNENPVVGKALQAPVAPVVENSVVVG